jgi:cobalt-zinc-cadmium efflux system protein
MGLTVVEVVAGIISGSLSLIADAVHNFSDAGALLIAFIARKISRKRRDERFTFGYRRAELIGAMINLTTLVVIGLMLVWQAIERFISPQSVETTWVFIAAGVALIVDLGTVLLLWAMSKGSLNVRAAFIHNLTDAAASVAVILGALGIQFFGWTWIDPALTLLIAGYILFTSVGMLKRTAEILMENAPPNIELSELEEGVEAIEHVEGIHHIHVWELDEHRKAFEAHLVLNENCNRERTAIIRQQVRDYLHERWEIDHCTLEVETPADRCAGDVCGPMQTSQKASA